MPIVRVGAVVVAAGRGRRFGGESPKQFADLGGIPVLAWATRAFRSHPQVARVIVVLSPERAASPPDWLPAGVEVVAGGVARADSVRAGARALEGEAEIILVHDGARPFPSPELVSRVIEAARRGPVVPVVPLEDTVKRVDGRGRIAETVPRGALRRAQTPQGFPWEVLARTHALEAGGEREAWDAAGAAAITDDALLCERRGIEVATVEGDPSNLKITTPRDLVLARGMVESGLISYDR